VKKATKSLWTSWWRAEAHEKGNIKRQALEVDKLLQLLKKKQIVEALNHYQTLDEAMKKSIHHHVWSIFIREENPERLARAIEEILPGPCPCPINRQETHTRSYQYFGQGQGPRKKLVMQPSQLKDADEKRKRLR